MLNVAVSFISGLTAFSFLPFFPISLSFLSLSVTIFLLIKHHEHIKYAVLIIFMFAFGMFYSFLSHGSPPEVIFPDEEVFVEGTVSDVPEMSDGKVRFTLSDVEVNGKDLPGKVRFYMFQEQFEKGIMEYSLSPGDRAGVLSVLREPSLFRNPGVYAYDLRKEGITAVGYVKRMRSVTARGSGLLGRKRQLLGEIISNSLSKEAASLHRAIVPGLKGSIDTGTREAFSAAGLAHLLSISGTHFGLLAFMIFQSVKLLVKAMPSACLVRMTLYITPSQIAVITTLPVLFLYAAISGASIPTVRSLIMVVIYMLALFLGRKGQWLNSLSIAALIILLWQPKALFELSFLLSFIAVLSIGFVLEERGKRQEVIDNGSEEETKTTENRQQKLITIIYEKVKTGIMMTVAAVMGTAPITAVVFKQFPLIAPLTNLLVTPVVCFVILPLGFFTGFCALLLDLPFMPLNGITDKVTGLALEFVRMFSALPCAGFRVHDPPAIMTLCYYLSLLLICKRGLRSRYKWELAPLLVIMAWYSIIPYQKGSELKATFLDVGQGEAVQIDLPDKKVMLIDGGTERPDTGRMAVAPFLWSRGIRTIDYLVLTHQHADHSGGLNYILEHFEVGELWLNGRPAYEAEILFRKIERYGIPFRLLKRGDVLNAEQYTVQAFHPYDEFQAHSARGGFSNQNSDSIVLKIESNGLSFLFTGDIEEEAEWDLLQLGKHLKSDIIKVPHHGGRTSSSADFIHTVKPRLAVISVGRDNRFGHPHDEALRRYQAAGTRIFRTDIDGAVTITPGIGEPEVTTYRDTEFKAVETWRDEIRNLRLLL